MVKLDSIIQSAQVDFDGKSVVAFIGERLSGKTVVVAILKHALVNHFVSDSSEWDAWVTSGSSRINDILMKLTNETYPSSTLPGDAKPITLEIFSKAGTGKPIEITLQDMAGESRDKFLRTEYTNEDQRLTDIFTAGTIKGKPYGVLAHLAFAKIYLIIIDCEKFSNWEHEQSYLANTVRSLSLIKKRVGKDLNGKIINPIAIIFSKYDRLPEIEQKSPEELLKKLPEFISALNITHRGKRKLFTSEIKSFPLTQIEIKELIIKELEMKNNALTHAQDNIQDKEVMLQNAQMEIDEAQREHRKTQIKLEDAMARNDPIEIQIISKKLEEMVDGLDMSRETFREITQEIKFAKLNLTEIYTRLQKEPPTARDLSISEFKPAKPLQYNIDQYVDLISWIIESNKE